MANKVPGIDMEQSALIKGDGRSYAIAAASILAKVTRDRQCMLRTSNFLNTALDT